MEKYEKIQKENIKLLNKFEEYLLQKNLSKKTIKRHINNVELYINDYLAIDEEESPQEIDGYTLESFFGWCIDKWIFNTVSGLLSMIISVDIFYEYLNENKPIAHIDEIRKVCANKEYYTKKFKSHERLLDM
ncbi:hypothetical protein HZC30_06235 [Candidatus Woesearchaeota archaeon]|nr:hypothetical protein [Candidatus Woesearchaeota archaeon]